MKAIVEWGKPRLACTSKRPCGVAGQFPVDSVVQAQKLAQQLFHTLTDGRESVSGNALSVSKADPRKVVWAQDCKAWVCVSVLDGKDRGAFAALADKEAARLIEAAAAVKTHTVCAS